MAGMELLLTHDRFVDSAYLYLRRELLAPIATTVPVTREGTWLGINLDLDADGHLVGIEVAQATSRLAPTLLELATTTDTLVDVMLALLCTPRPGPGPGTAHGTDDAADARPGTEVTHVRGSNTPAGQR